MTSTAIAARSAITWFEIPTADFDRARRFYESILEAPLRTEQFENARIAIFPYEGAGIGGCLDEGSHSSPSTGGTVVYLDVDGRLDATLARVKSAGGRVLRPKTALPPGMGCVAHIVDTEGNLIGLHALS